MLKFRFLSACSNLPYCTCILLVILALCGLIQSQQCYYPNGLKSGDTPCPQVSSDPHFTFCCAHDHTCSSNLLCITGLNPRTYARGSCTDSSWQSPSCPLFCQANAKTGGIGVTSCGSGTWCCDQDNQDNTCCDNATNLFFLEEARTNQSSSTSSSPTASGSLFSVSSARTSSSAPALALSTPTSAPSALPASAKAGIGVGVPVAVALFVLLIYLVIRNKRLRARIQDPSADGTNHLKEEMMSGHQKQMTLTPYELTNDTRRHELGEPQRHEMGLS